MSYLPIILIVIFLLNRNSGVKEVLQNFIDHHADEIAQILPGGLKNKDGRWILVCPIMERFDLDFSKVATFKEEKKEEVVEEVIEEKKSTKKTKKSKKK